MLTDLAVVAKVRTRFRLPRDRKEVFPMPEPIKSILAVPLIIFLTSTGGCVQGQATLSNDCSLGLLNPK